MTRTSRTIRIHIDPITRIEGHLGLRLHVDAETRKPTGEAWTFVTMFRGFEIFSIGRPPEDLPHVTSRICGVCGASHANASVLAVDMAYGVSPKPMGVVLRNMAFAMTDHIYDHSIILGMLEGPDYSAAIVSKFTPSVYDHAKKVYAEHRDIHGFTTIADIMEALNPLTGKVWQYAVRFQRLAREAGVLIYGRHSHPSTLIPGGISTDISDAENLLLAYTTRLIKLTAWVKWFYALWEDLLSFFEKEVTLPGGLPYSCNGLSYAYTSEPSECPGMKTTVLAVTSSGIFDDPEAYGEDMPQYDPVEFYKAIDKAAIKRLLKPGIVIRGELVSTSLKEYQRSIMEHVERAFYEDWDKPRWYREQDPEGSPLLHGKYDAKYHPWNKVTIPKLEGKAINWSGKYTWATHVRLVWKDGSILPFEVGPYARLLITSMHNYSVNVDGADAWFKAGGREITVHLPRACTDELPGSVCEPMEFKWKVPPISTTIYRLWARAFNLLLDVVGAWKGVSQYRSLLDKRYTETSRPWKVPRTITFGFGFTEAPRGTVRHWVVQENGKVLNVQIHAPTTGNVSPHDRFGYSPFEQSALNSWVTEELPPEEWQGLDFVRSIRSFDPCLACAVHLAFRKDGKTVKTVEKMLTHAYYTF
ncbi:nickel-dependent hydrogenase large subunit [Hyperthermus butylicus]|uniref:Periplasmic hydrogenase large subunit n=1 Tax=Hyperthermus butylicus (strain DSM 5456 / JCM 9403 / PLM1-5) TaxID=415426 RepID=A2BMI2_HYPBU|nr:nickel-dependent hydrogenase large subunit [Hyperthermus butylicus]ABM81193.1 Periplasmic hydrogenase large subunit [Hyperthermus butylicus DSM 5456]